MDIRLHIVSPEGTLVETEVSAVTLPGSLAPFEVLKEDILGMYKVVMCMRMM